MDEMAVRLEQYQQHEAYQQEQRARHLRRQARRQASARVRTPPRHSLPTRGLRARSVCARFAQRGRAWSSSADPAWLCIE